MQVRRFAQTLGTAFAPAAVLATSVVVGFGVPAAWLWVGSMVQGGMKPSMLALAVVLLGIAVSYMLLGLLFAWLNTRRTASGPGPVRHSWNRSMRDQRAPVKGSAALPETLAIVTVMVVAVSATVWFFFFAHINFGATG